jgi:fucose 4-O-acetylase-like acetyltransferase
MFIANSATMNFSKTKSANKIWIFACSLYLGFLIFISTSAYLKSLPPLLLKIPFADTFMHFLLLGLAAFFSHLALNKKYVMVFGIFLPQAPLIILLCCIADEMLQALSPNRTSSIIDLVANLAGIVLFYFLAEKVKLKS